MDRIVAPGRYYRGPDSLQMMGELVASLGERALITGGKRALAAAQEKIEKGLARAPVGKKCVLAGVEWYGGDCTDANARHLAERIRETNADVLIGVGGGRALDTAKLAARLGGVPVITVPTIAATCAAWTALSVVYTDKGDFLRNEYDVRNPDYVVVDPEIIANAPKRLLLSGIGDTLAKWFEVDITAAKAGPTATALSARSLGRVCYEILKAEAAKAIEAVDSRQVNESLNQVIDAVILVSGMVSGVGGIECRSAGAHAVYHGMTLLERAHEMYHGEMVAFGLVIMLAMMGEAKAKEIEEVIEFNRECGLPVTLEEAGIGELTPEEMDKVVAKILGTEEIRNMPFTATAERIAGAIRRGDELGHRIQKAS